MDNIICVVGPTASGKTRLAAVLAARCGGEVISCDSMQVYRGMSIGTAAPTPDETLGVPHHMIAVADPAEDFSAGRYVAMADPILRDILARGKTAVIAGGTGLYLDSLIAGRVFAPCPETGRREELEKMADERGMAAMLAYLAAFDPETAARLHPSDRTRVLRACEVYLETGETVAEHDRASRLVPPKYDAAWLGLTFADRADLYRRIDRRADAMLEAGLLGEIRALRARGVPDSATSLQAIGYKEPIAALEGRCTMDEAVAAIKRGTRRYAKRQLTWFRRNDKIHWIEQTDPPDFPAVLSEAVRFLASFDNPKW